MKKNEPERNIENRAVKWAKERGWITRKMNGMGMRSWPDRLFIRDVHCFAYIEFKRPGEVPTDQQRDLLNQLSSRGFHAAWYDDSEKAIAYLTQLSNNYPPHGSSTRGREVGAGSVPKAGRKVPPRK